MDNAIGTITSITGEQIAVYDANYDNSQMSQEDFLKVLLANFQYQDPFEAEDISQFIDDTLSLRQLETMDNFEEAVATLTSGSSATLLLQASSLIDQKVLYEGNMTYFQNGSSKIEFTLADSADTVELYVYDAEGNVVESETFTGLSAGTLYPFEIENGSIADGYYSVSIVAKNGSENVESVVYSTALVSGIERYGDQIVALYDYGSIDIDTIKQIGG